MMRYPNATGLVLRKNRESMTNSTLLQIQGVLGLPYVRNVVHKPQDHRFEFSNGSILAYGGMKDQMQREQIRSVGKSGSVDFAWLEEATAFDEDDFNEVMARMRGRAAPFRQIMLSTNPDGPQHWINKRLILGQEATVFYSGAKDNPHLPPEYVETLNKMSGILRQRLAEGKWVQAEGVVYDNFTYERHVIPPVDMPVAFSGYKEFIGGADSNFPLPRAGLLAAVTPNGEIHIVKEFYVPRAHPEDLGKWYSEFAKHFRTSVNVYHDPADQEAIAKLNGFPNVFATNAKNDVLPGINEVYRLLSEDRIKIDRSCVELISAIQSYKWKKGGEKQVPDKVDDHLPDALRYCIFSAATSTSGKDVGSIVSFMPIGIGG